MNILEHAECLIKRFQSSFTGEILPQELPESMPPPSLKWFRMNEFAREPAEQHEIMANATQTYSSLAASGTWAVFALVCDQQGALSLFIGLTAEKAPAAIKGIQALQQAKAEACETPILPSKAVFALEAAATGENAVPLDLVMDAMPPETALLMVLEPLAIRQLQPLISHLDLRRSRLSAMAQWTLQESSNSSKTRSTSLTEGKSDTKGTSETTGSSTNEAHVLARSTSAGTNHGASLLSINSGSSRQSGRGANIARGTAKSTQSSISDSTSESSSNSYTTADGTGESQSEQNSLKMLSFAEQEISLEARRKHFRRGISQGMVRAAYYIIGESAEAGMLSSMISSALTASTPPAAGDELPASFSQLTPSQVSALMSGGHPAGHGRVCLPAEIAALFPLHDHRGLSVCMRPRFGLNILMDDPGARLLPVGHVLGQNGKPAGRACLSMDAFTDHICVIGPSGVGKSNGLRLLTQGVLNALPATGVCVIDPKNEWLPSDLGEGARLFTARADGSCGEVLRINPFAVSAAASIQSHVDRLTEVLCGIWPLYAAMESILKQAIVRSYAYCGWDLTHNVRLPLFKRPVWPDWGIVSRQIRIVVKEHRFSTRNELDYTAALTARLDQLTVNTAGEIFVHDERALSAEELFAGKAVIHLQTLCHADLALVMSILALMLEEYSIEKAAGQRNLPLTRMVVFEEAHNIIPCAPISDNPEAVNLSGAATKAVVGMFQECRTLGTGVVLANQSFGDIDMNAVNNCGTKLLFSQGNSHDGAEAEACIGLDKNKAYYLTRLNRGECILHQRCMQNEPLLVKLDKVDGCTSTSHGFDFQRTRAWKTEVLLALLRSHSDEHWQSLLQRTSVPPDLRQLCTARIQAMASLDADGQQQALHDLLCILTGSLLKILPFPDTTDALQLRFHFKQLMDACHTYLDMKAFTDSERCLLAELLVHPQLRTADEPLRALIHDCIQHAA